MFVCVCVRDIICVCASMLEHSVHSKDSTFTIWDAESEREEEGGLQFCADAVTSAGAG